MRLLHLFVILFLAACSAKQGDKPNSVNSTEPLNEGVIEGRFESLEYGRVLVNGLKIPSMQDYIDTVSISDYTFTYTPPKGTDVLIRLIPESEVTPQKGWPRAKRLNLFYQPNDRLNFSAAKQENAMVYSIEGNLFGEAYSSLRNNQLPTLASVDSLTALTYQLNDNSAVGQVYQQRDSLIQSLSNAEMAFIRNNPGHPLSVYLLWVQPPPVVNDYMNQLAENAPASLVKLVELKANRYQQTR